MGKIPQTIERKGEDIKETGRERTDKGKMERKKGLKVTKECKI
jgi:hypothetical protein